MIALVTGGSGSGKSAYAESLATALFAAGGYAQGLLRPDGTVRRTKDATMNMPGSDQVLRPDGTVRPSGPASPQGRSSGCLIYLATMCRSETDEEIPRRIARHRAMRAGKGFHTVERERDLAYTEPLFSGHDTILLEDLSNLLGNELYGGPSMADPEEVVRKIAEPVRRISDAGNQIIIVTNEVGWDLPSPYEEARRFVRLFGRLNCLIADVADLAVEVTAGVPFILKKEGAFGC